MAFANYDDDCLPPTEFSASSVILHLRQRPHASAPTSSSATGLHKRSTESLKHLACPSCWRSTTSFLCPTCIVLIGQLRQSRANLEELVRERRRLLDDIARVYAAKNLAASDELRSATFAARLELRALKFNAALRIESCTEKLRRCREIRAAFDAKRCVVHRLKTTQSSPSLTANFDVTSNSVDCDNLQLARCRLFETRRRMAFDLFTEVFTVQRETDRDHCFDALHQSPCHEGNAFGEKSSTNRANYFERRASVRRSCGDLMTFGQSRRLPERQALTPIVDQSCSELVEALTEASSTNFFADRWFFSKQNRPRFKVVDYCVVDDFCDYDSWTPVIFGRIKNGPITCDSVLTHSYANGSLAALFYACRLVDGLARIFDVHLPSTPSSVTFFDAVGDRLTEAQFLTLSLLFNMRVAVLTAALGVQWQIQLSRPFHNLLRLMDCCEKDPHLKVANMDDPIPLPDAVCWRNFERAFNAVDLPTMTSALRYHWPRRRSHSATQEHAAANATLVRCVKNIADEVINEGEIVINKHGMADSDDDWETVLCDRSIDWSQVAPPTCAFKESKSKSAAALVSLVTSATTSVVNLFKNANI